MNTKKNITPHAELRYTFHGTTGAAKALGVSVSALTFFLQGKMVSRPLALKIASRFPRLLTPALIERYGLSRATFAAKNAAKKDA